MCEDCKRFEAGEKHDPFTAQCVHCHRWVKLPRNAVEVKPDQSTATPRLARPTKIQSATPPVVSTEGQALLERVKPFLHKIVSAIRARQSMMMIVFSDHSRIFAVPVVVQSTDTGRDTNGIMLATTGTDDHKDMGDDWPILQDHMGVGASPSLAMYGMPLTDVQVDSTKQQISFEIGIEWLVVVDPDKYWIARRDKVTNVTQ